MLERLSKEGKVGLGVCLAGTLFFLLAFSTPYWGNYSSAHFGLWEHCNDVVCSKTVSTRERNLFDTDWFRGTQALCCLALISLMADFVTRIMFLCGKPSKFLMLSIFLDCLTAMFAFIASVVFGSEVDRIVNISLDWSFAFNIISGILMVGSAICFLISYCRLR